jgi:hypothetical protein
MRRTFLTAAFFALGVLVSADAIAQPRIQQQPAQGGGAGPGGGGPGGGPGGGGGAAPQQQSSGAPLLAGTTPEISQQVLRAAGYADLEIITIQNARHLKGKVQGQNMALLHQNCENNICKTATFVIYYNQQQGIDINWVNAWNQQKRFTKLSIDPSNSSLTYEMDVHFFGDGVSATHFRDSAVLFSQMTKALLEFQPNK